MEKCELLDTCVFINDYLANLPSHIAMYKREFCHHDYEKCARYRLAQNIDRQNVPKDLAPIDHERAEEILASVTSEAAEDSTR